MLRNSKKSAIEIQFNWIFVLIAGTVIFVFIISLILSQKKSVDIQVSQDVLKQLATNIKGKQQLSNTFSQMETPKTTYTFTCDPVDLSADFKISGSQREQLPLEIIFTPKEFNTQTLNIWTLDFAVPFTVTRFIYITPPNMIFVIYNKSEQYQTQSRLIYNTLPSNITKKFADDNTELTNALKGYKNYRVICFDNDCNGITQNYVSIHSLSTDIFGYGTLGYNTQALDTIGIKYIGQASLFGAIFSDDEKYYRCEMDRAFKQFEIKRSLHHTRVELLQADLGNGNTCKFVLTSPANILGRMKNKVLANADELYSLSNELKNANTDLTFKGCPLIY